MLFSVIKTLSWEKQMRSRSLERKGEREIGRRDERERGLRTLGMGRTTTRLKEERKYRRKESNLEYGEEDRDNEEDKVAAFDRRDQMNQRK